MRSLVEVMLVAVAVSGTLVMFLGMAGMINGHYDPAMNERDRRRAGVLFRIGLIGLAGSGLLLGWMS